MKRLLLYLALLPLLAGCISDFTPEVKGVDGILVVDGMITTGESVFRLSRSISIMGDLRDNDTILNAVLNIERSDGVLFEASQEEKGVYKIRNGELDPGLAYRLNLTVDHKRYQSTFLKPLFTPEIDSLNYRKKGREEPVTIRVSSHAGKDASPYYRWSYKENWEVLAPLYANYGQIDGKTMYFNPHTPDNTYHCWVKDSSKILLIGTTEKLVENRLVEHKLFEIPAADERLSVLYHVEVSQMQIRKEAYDYFKMLQEEIERTGSIFSPVMSAGDNGNIFNLSDPDELVIGYVEVASVTRKGMYLSYEMDLYVPDKVEHCEIFTKEAFMSGLAWYRYPDSMTYPRCVDCRKGNATKQRPSWWPNDHY
ncbi:DUF4249 domain-containing protein [Parabacteroides sp.]